MGTWIDFIPSVSRFFGSAEICAQIVVLYPPSPTNVISEQMVDTRKPTLAGHASPTFATNMERKIKCVHKQFVIGWRHIDNILPVHFLLPPVAAIWCLLCALYIHGTTLGVIMHATLICLMNKCKFVLKHYCQRPKIHKNFLQMSAIVFVQQGSMHNILIKKREINYFRVLLLCVLMRWLNGCWHNFFFSFKMHFSLENIYFCF